MSIDKHSTLVAICTIPLFWFFLQYIYSFSIFDSYWADLAAYYQPILVFPIQLFTRYSLTFLIILSNVLVFFLLVKKNKKLFFPLIVISITMTASFAYSYTKMPDGDPFTVALIQANVNEPFEWRVENADRILFEQYSRMTKEASLQNPDLIIWPEYAIPQDIRTNTTLATKISNLAQTVNTPILFGSFYSNGTKRYDVAILVLANGSFYGNHTSIVPIPTDSNVLGGTSLNLLPLDTTKFGVTICYEETQRYISKEYRLQGADFIVSLSNHQHFSHSRNGLHLGSIHARLNAVENGLYVVRSTNTGLTQIINPYGKIVASLDPNQEGILVKEIYI